MGCIAVKIVHVKMVLSAITSAVHVNVLRGGWVPIAIFPVPMAPMVQIVVKIVNAKIRQDVEKMMGIVFVILVGWEPIATMFARKVFMVNIVWSSVHVRRHNLPAMQLMDANVDRVSVELIV